MSKQNVTVSTKVMKRTFRNFVLKALVETASELEKLLEVGLAVENSLQRSIIRQLPGRKKKKKKPILLNAQ